MKNTIKKLLKEAKAKIQVLAASTGAALASVLPPLSYDAVDSIQLHQMLLNMTLPPGWMKISVDPLTICRILRIAVCTGKPAKPIATISIGRELKWSLHYLEHTLSVLKCPMLHVLPSKVESVAVVQQMICLIDNSNFKAMHRQY